MGTKLGEADKYMSIKHPMGKREFYFGGKSGQSVKLTTRFHCADFKDMANSYLHFHMSP
jgi:hypothetical protein